VAEDNAAGLDGGESLKDLGGHARHKVAGITKNDVGGRQVRPGVPGIDAAEDLLNLGFGGLLPVEVADLVLAGDGREIESDDFTVVGELVGDIDGGAAFGGAKFDDFFGLEVADDFAEDIEFLGGNAEVAGHGKEEFGGAGEVNLREEFFDRFGRDIAIAPPGESFPGVRHAETGIEAIGLCNEVSGGGRTVTEQKAQGVEIEG